jgi:hypothetical protein
MKPYVIFFVLLVWVMQTACSDDKGNGPPEDADAGDIIGDDGEDTGCPPGQILCGYFCVEPSVDRLNCGECGFSCDPLADCVSGECLCREPYVECAGQCVDTSADRSHCGMCNNRCDPLGACVHGLCLCPEGLRECSGRCVDLDTDPENCGACDNECDFGQVCNGAGMCDDECLPTMTLCYSRCTDPDTDPLNCGSCGNSCGPHDHAMPRCVDGDCEFECDDGYMDANQVDLDDCECVFQSETETCDAVDNDCDGAVDETLRCVMGSVQECDLVASCQGMQLCNAECVWGPCVNPALECSDPGEAETQDCGDGSCGEQTRTCQDTCTWSPWETCYLKEGNDCFTGDSESRDCGGGSCGAQSRDCLDTCTWTPWTDCALKTSSVCYAGDTESEDCGAGSCGEQTRTCSSDCIWGTLGECALKSTSQCFEGESRSCTTSCGGVSTQSCTSECVWEPCGGIVEVCNGEDDDCDTVCDNGFDCCRGETGSCTTSCGTTGSRSCSSSCAWTACAPPSETCNGEDDDCDGTCDDGFACCSGVTEACTTSCGTTGSRVCSTACTWGSCAPPGEVCNGADDDCDGACDEDFDCRAGEVQCCSSGTAFQVCTASCSWGACTQCSVHVPSSTTCCDTPTGPACCNSACNNCTSVP